MGTQWSRSNKTGYCCIYKALAQQTQVSGIFSTNRANKTKTQSKRPNTFYFSNKKAKKHLYVINKNCNFVPDYSATGSIKSPLSD
ncbi:hypothetical protein JCM10512_630 [Bacteroides reticulotermitis JCM 10512]|uniref:Uncharacterized protein n=1 Tax=Bacteroides reticulotermitis JCM 10512 TaxID=1445607 RepID=W4UP78_9BACE|nr:hypothetical protein JCM10512_630 [Bacteroides reticulotermitis JCM 10512]